MRIAPPFFFWQALIVAAGAAGAAISSVPSRPAIGEQRGCAGALGDGGCARFLLGSEWTGRWRERTSRGADRQRRYAPVGGILPAGLCGPAAERPSAHAGAADRRLRRAVARRGRGCATVNQAVPRATLREAGLVEAGARRGCAVIVRVRPRTGSSVTRTSLHAADRACPRRSRARARCSAAAAQRIETKDARGATVSTRLGRRRREPGRLDGAGRERAAAGGRRADHRIARRRRRRRDAPVASRARSTQTTRRPRVGVGRACRSRTADQPRSVSAVRRAEAEVDLGRAGRGRASSVPGWQVSVSPDFAVPVSAGGGGRLRRRVLGPGVGAKSRMNAAIVGSASSV